MLSCAAWERGSRVFWQSTIDEGHVPMTQATLAEFVEFAVATAEAAGRTILPFFRNSIEVVNKAAPGQFDPVTAADRAAEDFIRVRIRERFPDHGILGVCRSSPNDQATSSANRCLSCLCLCNAGTFGIVRRLPRRRTRP